MTDGIAAVQARISEIQRLFPTSAVTQGATGGTAAGGTGFAAVLDQARTGTGTGGGSGGSGSGGSGSGGGSGATSGSPSGADVVADARKYLGVPYVWGGTDPKHGLDCSGLVQQVYCDLGISLPRVSGDQAREGRAVSSLSEARPGDLLAFGHPVHHIAIYVGDGKMLEAPRPGKNVRIAPISETPSAIRRILPDAPAGGGTGAVKSTTAAAASHRGGEVPYASLFRAAAVRHGVPAKLLAAVAKAESDFDPREVSGAGARGIMQLMPENARELHVDPFDPAQAIDGGARMLAGYLRKYGDISLALAAYNAGPGAVHRYGGVPPYRETQTYVKRVQRYMTEVTV